MKYFLLLLFSVFCVSFLAQIVHAQSPTTSAKPTSSASPAADEDQVERIKDIVASRVAELNLVEKKGVLGKVIAATSTQITIEDINGDKRIIEIDELTKFNNPDDDDFGISDVDTGATIGIIGLLNKAADRILARFVNTVDSIPEYFEGVVTEIDEKNFQFRAVDENGKERTIDIVTSTKTSSYNDEDGLVKSGFSKIELGQRIYAAGFTDNKVKEQLNATRVIHFLELTPSEKMMSHADATEEPEESPTPTEEEE